MTIALQALSLVEKAELVQVRFTLRLKDQRSMWMQDGCIVYMASNGSFHGHLTIFKNHLLEVDIQVPYNAINGKSYLKEGASLFKQQACLQEQSMQ